MSIWNAPAHHRTADSVCHHAHRQGLTSHVDALDVTKALWDELVAELLADTPLLA